MPVARSPPIHWNDIWVFKGKAGGMNFKVVSLPYRSTPLHVTDVYADLFKCLPCPPTRTTMGDEHPSPNTSTNPAEYHNPSPIPIIPHNPRCHVAESDVATKQRTMTDSLFVVIRVTQHDNNRDRRHWAMAMRQRHEHGLMTTAQ